MKKLSPQKLSNLPKINTKKCQDFNSNWPDSKLLNDFVILSQTNTNYKLKSVSGKRSLRVIEQIVSTFRFPVQAFYPSHRGSNIETIHN